MFVVVNAADTGRHPGFERFAVGPGRGPVVGRGDLRTASCHAQAPDLGPLGCTPLHPPGATAAKKRRHHTLISFIWSPGNPLPAGTGGSENYTVGQVRELTRR